MVRRVQVRASAMLHEALPHQHVRAYFKAPFCPIWSKIFVDNSGRKNSKIFDFKSNQNRAYLAFALTVLSRRPQAVQTSSSLFWPCSSRVMLGSIMWSLCQHPHHPYAASVPHGVRPWEPDPVVRYHDVILLTNVGYAPCGPKATLIMIGVFTNNE